MAATSVVKELPIRYLSSDSGCSNLSNFSGHITITLNGFLVAILMKVEALISVISAEGVEGL